MRASRARRGAASWGVAWGTASWGAADPGEAVLRGLAPLGAVATAPMFGTYGFGFRGRVQAALGRGHVRPLVAAQGLYFPARGASLSTGALTAGAVFGARDHGRGLYVRITPTAAPPGGDRECTRLRRVVKWLPDEPRAS